MSNMREAAEQALEALEHENTMVDRGDGHWEFKHDLASAALRAALAEHFCDTHCTWADHAPGCVRAEPVHDDAVYWYVGTDGKYYSSHEAELFLDANTKALYKKPPQWRLDKCDLIPLVAYRPRKPLTDEEIADMWVGILYDSPPSGVHEDGLVPHRLARAVERAHGIKENP